MRNLYLDSLKGYLICLVVLGHLIALNLTNPLNLALYNEIYIFHMPLFILLSGYFSNVNSSNYKKGCLRILETYIVFQLLRTAIEYPHDFIKKLFYPRTAMWYLLSLFYWKVSLLILPKQLYHKKGFLLAGSLLLSLFAGFFQLTTLMSFQRTFYFLPFFMLGFCLRKTNIKKYFQSFSSFVCIMLIVSLLLSLYIINDSIYMHFAGFEIYSSLIGAGKRVLYVTISLVLCLIMMKILKQNMRMADIGKESLYIYIYHSFIAFYLLPFLCKSYCWPTNFLSILIYSSLTILLLYYFSKKCTLLSFLMNPFTKTYELLKSKR